jgi:hypothetical protein
MKSMGMRGASDKGIKVCAAGRENLVLGGKSGPVIFVNFWICSELTDTPTESDQLGARRAIRWRRRQRNEFRVWRNAVWVSPA